MTISTLDFYKVYIAAAAQTVFPYPYKILAAADLHCWIDGTEKVFGVDFTVSGAGANAGNLTLLVACAGGETVVLRRKTPKTQSTDLAAAARYSEEDIEAMADRLTLIAQETPSGDIPLSPDGYFLQISGGQIIAVASLALGAAMPFDTGSARPTTGSFTQGHFRLRVPAIAGESLGWSLCTDGEWHESGFVSANPV